MADRRAAFQTALGESAMQIDQALDRFLPGAEGQLGAAMRHAVLGGGKRLRGFLALETAGMFRVPVAQALRNAAAVECIHAYSLVHDDFPAMDDDAIRRGQPTVHVKWDEATAVLAGDALQALAFESGEPEGRHRSAHPDAAGLGAGGGRGCGRHGGGPGARSRGGDHAGTALGRRDHRASGAQDRGADRLGRGIRRIARAVRYRAVEALCR